MVLHRWHAAAWLLGGLILAGCSDGPQPGAVLDEAKLAGRDAASFQHSADDYFHDMDGGVELDADGGRRPQHVDGLERRQRPLLDQHDRLHLRRVRPAEDGQLAPEPGLQRATSAGTTSAWSTSPASRRRPAPTRAGAASGSTCAARTAPPIRSRTKRSTPAWRSARAASRSATARPSRSARSTATPPASSACACSRTRRSTRRPPRRWDPSATTPTRATTTARTWCGRTASACRAASATSARARSIRRPIRRKPTFANLSSSVGAQYMWVDRLFIYNSNKPEGRKNYMYQLAHTYPARARWTPRWSRPTTSTTRAP